MSGTRTAPVVTGALTSGIATLHLMDASGDPFTENISYTSVPTTIVIEAWADKYQAATQATLWKVTMSSCWEGAMDASNTTNNQRSTIAEGVNNLYKNPTTALTNTLRLVAPIEAVMQGNQDIPLLSATEMSDLIVAELAILVGYNHNSAQFTGRRERKNNPRVVT